MILRSSSRVSGWPQCPLYPQKRTLPQRKQMSALRQKRTFLPGFRAVSARSFRGRPNTQPSGEATERWDVHWYGIGARFPAILASRPVSPPTFPAAHRRSSRAIGSCCPLPRRRASLSSKSRRLSILAADSKRCASCPRGVQPRECRGSQPSHCSGAGRPAFHMKWAMRIQRPSNVSGSITFPHSPISANVPSTSTIGSRRRGTRSASSSA